jgi:hypothetical protein
MYICTVPRGGSGVYVLVVILSELWSLCTPVVISLKAVIQQGPLVTEKLQVLDLY